MENTHGKNTIEAVGDKAVQALHAVTDKGTENRSIGTASGAESIGGKATAIATAAASSLGAIIPEANKAGTQQEGLSQSLTVLMIPLMMACGTRIVAVIPCVAETEAARTDMKHHLPIKFAQDLVSTSSSEGSVEPSGRAVRTRSWDGNWGWRGQQQCRR